MPSILITQKGFRAHHTHCYKSVAPPNLIKILIKDIKKTAERCSSLRGILDISQVVASEFS